MKKNKARCQIKLNFKESICKEDFLIICQADVTCQKGNKYQYLIFIKIHLMAENIKFFMLLIKANETKKKKQKNERNMIYWFGVLGNVKLREPWN